MKTIPVLYSFARSGGTLVNQLLGAHQDCAVLSEVNPAASFKPIAEQAREWLSLIEAGEAEGFSRLPYADQVEILHRRAGERGKSLVVRDWVTANFLPDCAGDLTVPSGELEQQLYLENAGFETLPLVVTRRSEAVYRSIQRSFPHLRGVERDTFAQAYLAYARAVVSFPRVHLEALRAQPLAAWLGMLRRFALDESAADRLLETFHAFRKCTGNTALVESNESAAALRILAPEAPRPEAEGQRSTSMMEADRLLGYEE